MVFSLYNMLQLEPELFKNITIPSGLNKDTLVNSILDQAGDMEPVTTYPRFLQMKIDNFFIKYYDNFLRLYNASLLKYEPIENYDKNETTTRTLKGTNKNTLETSGNNKVEEDGTITDSTTGKNTRSETLNGTFKKGDIDTTNKVSAYDSSNFQNANSSTTTNGTDTTAQTTNTTDNTEGSRTEKTKNTKSGTDSSKSTGNGENTESETITNRTHGNIGVTTSQQMLQSEVDLWYNYNVYNYITEKFITELMLTVY